MILESQIEVQKRAFEHAGVELYENIGQILSVAKLQLHLLESSQLNTHQQQFVEQTTNLLDKAIIDLRALIRNLESYLKKDFDLSLNLSIEVERMRKLLQKNIELTIKGKPYQLKYEKEIVLFRVLQDTIQYILTGNFDIKIALTYESIVWLEIGSSTVIVWNKANQKSWSNIEEKLRLIGATLHTNQNSIVIQILK